MQWNKNITFADIKAKTYSPQTFENIFYALMITGILVFLSGLALGGLWRCQLLFFDFGSDTFMDFFNPIAWAHVPRKVYNNVLFVYPPLAGAFCAALSSFVPDELARTFRAFALRESAVGLTMVIVYSALITAAFSSMLLQLKGGRLKNKILFTLFIIFSAPFIFYTERANLIMLAVLPAMFFVFFYDSPKPALRNLAVFALAAATAIKIYPAFLGLLLLKDRRWKDILLLALYTLLLFLIPVLWLGGPQKILTIIQNIRTTDKMNINVGIGYSLSLYNTFRTIGISILSAEYVEINKLFSCLVYVFGLWGVAAACFLKTKWKVIALLSCLLIMIPIISGSYTMLFMVIPLMFLLDDGQTKTFKDLIYLFLFAAMFALNFPALAPGSLASYFLLVDNLFQKIAMFIMLIMLSWEGTLLFLQRGKGGKDEK